MLMIKRRAASKVPLKKISRLFRLKRAAEDKGYKLNRLLSEGEIYRRRASAGPQNSFIIS
jgi:hypothetical protein